MNNPPTGMFIQPFNFGGGGLANPVPGDLTVEGDLYVGDDINLTDILRIRNFIGDLQTALRRSSSSNKMYIGDSDWDLLQFRADGDSSLMFLNADGLDLRAPLQLEERASDPPDPAEGHCTLWQSDGSATGDAGDILVKITTGAVTKTITLVDFSAG